MSGQRKSIVWHLLKVAGLWFAVGQAAVIAANTYGLPSKPFTYLAMAIFFLHSVLVIYDTSSSNDTGSGKLYSGGITIVLVGGVIFLSLRATQTDDFQGARKRTAFILRDFSDWVAGTDQTIHDMGARDHLAAAVKLIFEQGTRLALNLARQHLQRIPPNAVEYASAQNLLSIADARLRELDKIVKGQSPIEITRREQEDGRYRVTVRNSGSFSVKNVHYRVTYFRIPSGFHVEPDTEGVISKPLRPQESRTVEVVDDILETPVHASFSIVNWEAGGS